jgi:ABC-type transport system involved in cytochrome bd biosynthesis fused ATPase/permease subunit
METMATAVIPAVEVMEITPGLVITVVTLRWLLVEPLSSQAVTVEMRYRSRQGQENYRGSTSSSMRRRIKAVSSNI